MLDVEIHIDQCCRELDDSVDNALAENLWSRTTATLDPTLTGNEDSGEAGGSSDHILVSRG